ncbi:MAG TPA: TetR/AcrR family transcriptional regulator [Baekduia sp.]|uniref:TetR/AcrR family transcriptional regulator n=1 Tax=Baekduia sp. TaxID=2600305 RepID=UPI002D787FB9|nr:TetR/AcrR family transcriptional regulator [Baekduia sp.]HET6505649.1 TetR/AcrR family transcriptional regulator [Baekduia sp.]
MPAADTRTAVLDAAARLFDARGFAAVSIGELTAASGVSNGSIYHHFGSKEGVLAEVVAGALEGYHRTLLAALAAHEGDGPGGVRAAVAHELAWFARHPREARLLLAHRDAVAATGRLRAPNRAVLRAVDAWARAAIGPEIDLDLLHAVVFSPARSIGALWVAKRIENDPTTYAAALGDAAWAGLKATR